MNQKRTPAQIITIAIGISIVVASLTGAAYWMLVKVPADAAGAGIEKTDEAANRAYSFVKRVMTDLGDVFGGTPTVTIHEKTVIEGRRSISELATKELRFDKAYAWEHTAPWTRSTKRMEVRGTFVAKAGCDLTKPFTLDVSEDLKTVRATLPPTKVLSVEMLEMEVVVDEEGWWNGISKKDREGVINKLLAAAKKHAHSSDLLADADAELLSKLKEAMRQEAVEVTVVRTGK